MQFANVNALNSKKAAVSAANKFGNRVAAKAATAKDKRLGIKTLNKVNLANAVNKKDQLGR